MQLNCKSTIQIYLFVILPKTLQKHYRFLSSVYHKHHKATNLSNIIDSEFNLAICYRIGTFCNKMFHFCISFSFQHIACVSSMHHLSISLNICAQKTSFFPCLCSLISFFLFPIVSFCHIIFYVSGVLGDGCGENVVCSTDDIVHKILLFSYE